MDRLKDKIILISGGARGQGAAEARLFVSEGAQGGYWRRTRGRRPPACIRTGPRSGSLFPRLLESVTDEEYLTGPTH
jgi:NAD(P)-dependent dehydrogenase (short-subunit alcohol dehydrogenase family)